MKYEIPSSVFWKNLKEEYDISGDWHLADKRIQSVTKKKLGLKYLDTDFIDLSNVYDTYFIFEVVNYEKFLWARLKYGI